MKLPEKKCVYTVVTGGYDTIFPPIDDQPGWDMLYFTDDASATSDFWQILPLPELPERKGLENDPKRTARMVKILPHRFLQDYEYSVFIDGNRILNGSLDDYLSDVEGDMVCFASEVGDAYAAADKLLHLEDADDAFEFDKQPPLSAGEKERLEKQIKKWKKAGLPEYSGCPGTSVLGRWHNKDTVQATMEIWAKEVLQGCAYDEPAFPYACLKSKTEWTETLSQKVQSGALYSPAYEFAPSVPHIGIVLGDNPPEKTEYPENPPPPGGPYGGYPYLLTIGVPVSNQIKTIRRCMEGIKPLLDALPAELVVVDTGSTDGTVEVCLEYGARVVKFPWINDMSAARNNAIRAAQGMWFMSIDDDEYFDDTSDMIAFFQNPEMRERADMAYYDQKNFSDDFGANFSLAVTARTAKMTPGLHFEGRIHDALIVTPSDGKAIQTYYFKTKANHFGFAGTNFYQVENKAKRNLAILKYDFAQFPNDFRYAYQMENEFIVARKPGRALTITFWMMSLLRQYAHGGRQDHVNHALGHSVIAFLQFAQDNWQAIRFVEKFIRPDDYGTGDRINLVYSIADLYHRVQQEQTAFSYVQQYDELKAAYSKLSEQEQALSNKYIKASPNQQDELNRMAALKASIQIGLSKIQKATDIVDKAETAVVEDSSNTKGDEGSVLDVYFKFRRVFTGHLITEQRLAELEEVLRIRLQKSPDSLYNLYPELDEVLKPKRFASIRKILENIEAPKTAFEPVLQLREMEKGDPKAAEVLQQAVGLLPQFITTTLRYFKMVLICEAIRLGTSPSPVFATTDVPDIDYAVAYLNQISSERVSDYYQEVFEWQKTENETAEKTEEYFRMQCALIVFQKRSDEYLSNEEAYEEHFITAVDRKWTWLGQLFHPDLLGANPSPILPLDVQTICVVQNALVNYQEGNQMEALRGLRTALNMDTSLKRPINFMVDKLVPEVEATLAKSKAQNREFSMLLQTIKPKIDQLIDAGMLAEATPLVTQLEALAPEDPDILALKSKLNQQPPS